MNQHCKAKENKAKESALELSSCRGASSAASGPDPDRLNQDDWKKERDRKKGIGVRLSISTTPGNVDEIAKRAKNAGINLKSEPHDTEWDNRAFEVSDPSGFLLTIFSETSAVGQLWVASPVEHVIMGPSLVYEPWTKVNTSSSAAIAF
jgi:hypothetical protein